MKQIVQVLTVTGNRATVAYDRPTACHGDCHKCAGGCGSMAAKERVTVTAENLVGARPGDKVVIEAASGAVFSAVALVYVLPVVLFFAGYFAGEKWNAGALLGGVGFFLGLAAAVVVSRRQTRTGREIQFRIVAYSK